MSGRNKNQWKYIKNETSGPLPYPHLKKKYPKE